MQHKSSINTRSEAVEDDMVCRFHLAVPQLACGISDHGFLEEIAAALYASWTRSQMKNLALGGAQFLQINSENSLGGIWAAINFGGNNIGAARDSWVGGLRE